MGWLTVTSRGELAVEHLPRVELEAHPGNSRGKERGTVDSLEHVEMVDRDLALQDADVDPSHLDHGAGQVPRGLGLDEPGGGIAIGDEPHRRTRRLRP